MMHACPRCKGSGRTTTTCSDPQHGDSTWDHACGDGYEDCVLCDGSGHAPSVLRFSLSLTLDRACEENARARQEMARLRQERCLDRLTAHTERLERVMGAVIAHVIACGPCECADEGESYCDANGCTYCTMTRAIDGDADG